MQESSPYLSPESGNITKANLLRKIWLEPQATLRYVLARCPDEYVTRLFILGGIARAVGRAAGHYPGSKLSVAASLVFALVGGSISGMVTYTAYAWAMRLLGGWLGGKASSNQFKTVLGWALVPAATALLLLLPALAIQSGELPIPKLTWLPNTLLIGCGLAEIVLGSWSTIILVQGVALIQGFTLSRALANVLLPGTVLLGTILLIATFY